MPLSLTSTSTAFEGDRRLAGGSLVEVALAVKARQGAADAPVLVFDDATGAVIDLDLRGPDAEILARLAARFPSLTSAKAVAEDRPMAEGTDTATRGRGRPKLGVIAREVTLLPRQWEWLAAQPGGASQTLRRLVDTARRADGDGSARRNRQEAAYRFVSAMAGNLPGFEEASRALFAGDPDRFTREMASWPTDIRAHAQKLAGYAPDT
ncbi:MAG TPA: DUF2239 family protein [Mesorhizobium sp.]|jgi:hypothetical protein|uniref:DUF2239 family protein n=1 Tax=Mesorhizobium sp. TaxID=1871066 RepID=UPI002DDD1AAE|nr:DUF2239 family protein [Mesorhizobium sp.]HEV2504984.1 DUF2239 family protein [Mesorhizobium sp.]